MSGSRHSKIPFQHEWVLHLDADEIVTPALHTEMRAAIAATAWRWQAGRGGAGPAGD